MSILRPCLTIFLFLLLTCIATAHILDLETGEYVSLNVMLDDLEQSKVIFIGELHDRADHHAAQLEIIKILRQRGHKVAIGLEMFQARHQFALDQWVSKKITENEFLPIYQSNWSMWPQYEEIFQYARREDVPLLGLNVDRDITRKVMREGFASLEKKQLEKLPMIGCDVDPLYKEYMRRALGGHTHGSQGFNYFCEAQLVWDKTMAYNLKKYLDQNDDVLIVVLAGTGHAWKYGIPEQLGRLADIRMRVVLPQLPGSLRNTMATQDETDYLMEGLELGPMH